MSQQASTRAHNHGPRILRAERILWKLKAPLCLLALVVGVTVVLPFAPERIRSHTMAVHGPKILFFLGMLWLCDRVIRLLFKGGPASGLMTNAARSLLLLIARIVLYSLGLLVILDNLGVSLTPLLASLGVTSLAVALALQDTLGNFFSGIYMLVDQPVRPGDTIAIDAGYQGKVLQIGWRSTRVLLASGNELVIPNTKLASSLITNFDFPTSQCNVSCSFALNHLTNLTAAEKSIQQAMDRTRRDCAPSLMQVPPTMNFQSVTDRGIVVNVTFKANNISEQSKVTHFFIKNLSEELLQTKIEFAMAPR